MAEEKTKKPLYKRKWLWAVLIFLVIAFALGGGEGDGETVELNLEPKMEGERLTIIGNTNLPDGAMLAYEISHVDAPFVEGFFKDGSVTVKNGQYEAEFDLTGWPKGKISVWVSFQTILAHGEQPEHVIEKYGEMGEYIEGENVDLGALKRVAIEKFIEKKEGPDISTKNTEKTSSTSITNEQKYIEKVSEQCLVIGKASNELASLLQNPQFFNDEWVMKVAAQIVTIRAKSQEAIQMEAPESKQHAHAKYKEAMKKYNKATYLLVEALDNLDPKLMEETHQMLVSGSELMLEAIHLLDQ
ncbi:MAG TPA: hypothetical protein PKI14_15435 [Fervidobacterium sp.]|nr:hypothetical protein [Fervidobacterium sp.]